jgi:hypothetical protein
LRTLSHRAQVEAPAPSPGREVDKERSIPPDCAARSTAVW